MNEETFNKNRHWFELIITSSILTGIQYLFFRVKLGYSLTWLHLTLFYLAASAVFVLYYPTRFMKTPLLKYMVTDPNSPEGLRMRSERMRKLGDKLTNLGKQENCYLYAECLSALAEKGLSPRENKQLLARHLKSTTPQEAQP